MVLIKKINIHLKLLILYLKMKDVYLMIFIILLIKKYLNQLFVEF
jgi:hypothetical protein